MAHPAALPGLTIVTGQVTIDNTKTATIRFPAKGVWSAFGTIGTAAVAGAVTITNGIAEVVYTAGANGTLNYLIFASLSEQITVTDAGTDNIVITPTV